MKQKILKQLSILILVSLSGVDVRFGSNTYFQKKSVVLNLKQFMKHVDYVYPCYLPGESPDERAERLLLKGMEVVNEYLNKYDAIAVPKNRFFEKGSDDITALMCEALTQKKKDEDAHSEILAKKLLEQKKAKDHQSIWK